MTSYAERVADVSDPLRALLQAARRWRVPPTVFIGQRTVRTSEWTAEDSLLAMALENYEAGLCPGGNHELAETSRPEHEDAYRPGEQIRCYYCKALAAVNEVQAKDEDSAGVLTTLVLDPAIVELNRQPVPPLPPELAAL